MNRDRTRFPRLALGDLTNQLGKRGFSFISRASVPAIATGAAKAFTKENNSELAKTISLVVKKNSEVEISDAKYTKIAKVDQSLPSLKGGKTYRLLSRGNSNPEKRIRLSCAENKLGGLSSGNVCSQSIYKHDLDIDGTSRDPVSEGTQEEACIEHLGSQTGSTDECPQFGGLRSTKPFQLERCMCLESASSYANSAASPCSICTKELHYMDAKGRISALLKSKKDASNLVKMFSSRSCSHTCSELELDLMNRTKSLFTSLEQIFGKECSQLESEFSSLKDVRENFKGMPP